ncbi:MAG: ATP-binding protein [Acidobacteria bacterium]|nr:ATP-binding protein [Acidobacteriota bacterium]
MLHTLEIYALRGATEKFVLPFEKGKKITILYGENGSGKSTICDSLELLSDGKVGSLDGKGLGKTQSYWHSTGKKPSDLSVILKTSKGQWEVRLAKSKAVVDPDAGRPQVKVLRRSQLLNLIAAQAKDRYEVISPFIDISGAEKSGNSLRRLLESERVSLESASARIEENRAALERFWEQAGRPGISALSWARSEVQNQGVRRRPTLKRHSI